MRLEFRPGLAAMTLGLALAGCGAPAEPLDSAVAVPSAGGTLAVLEQTPKAKIEQKKATPVEKVDTKDVPPVVKGDVKGGEAQLPPTPEDYLYSAPDTSLIKDEPYNVEVPKGLQPLVAVVPPSNPLTKGRVELGRQLYFDPRVSLDGTVSCATCHNPSKGWTDQLKTSTGIDGQKGGRNAPTVLNTVYGKTMFWDGRAPSLEGQCQGPPQNPVEMGKQSYKMILDRLRAIPGYKKQFKDVFGTDVTLDGFAKAIASFERAFALSGNSAYDRYNTGELDALTPSQKRGMILFGLRLDRDDDFQVDAKLLKKADCTSCHVGFNFTDEQFHNLGIGWDDSKKDFSDIGRFAIEPIGGKNLASRGAFKTPTVRDAENTAPYMHDGSLKTLEEVVEHYNKGGNANPALDKDMKKLNLTDQEKADVVAFMKALTGTPIKVELPKLPAGPDGKSPDPVAALTPPKAPSTLQ